MSRNIWSCWFLSVSTLVVAGLALTAAETQPATSVLFVGNSFTFGNGSPVRFYRAETVTDLNGEGIGGVPALFKSFTAQAGLDYDVSLETRGGAGFEFHLAREARRIGEPAVGQSRDAGPEHARSRQAWRCHEADCHQSATRRLPAQPQPEYRALSVATWSRADQTYPQKGAWFGKPIEAMARDVRIGNDKAAAGADIKTVIPVGEAWTRAIQTGVADPNPYDGVEAGKLDLWTYDHYHASTSGYYLEALVEFGTLTQRDPRALGDNECSGYELGLERGQVKALQQVAFDELAAAGLVKPVTALASKPTAPERCAAGR